MAQPWLIRSEMQPAFEGGFIQSRFLIGGIFTVKNKAQRNSIHYLNRKLDATTTTLVVVTDENRIYKLISNPTTTFTTDVNWEVFFLGQSSSFRPVGTWDADNDVIILQDIDALNRNGEFYFVSDAETQRTIQHDGLFDGATVDVVNGDLVVSIGDRWTVITSTVQWDALNKPSVIDDYVDGIVIAHTHVMADITDLATAMGLKYDIGDTADHTIDFEDVPDLAIVEVEFLRQFYYTKSEMDDLVDTVGGFWPLEGSAGLTDNLIITSSDDLIITTSQDFSLGGNIINLVTDNLHVNLSIGNNDANTKILAIDDVTGKVQYRNAASMGWAISGQTTLIGNAFIDSDGTPRNLFFGSNAQLASFIALGNAVSLQSATELSLIGDDEVTISSGTSTINLVEGRLTATLDVNNYIDLYASQNQLALGARTIRGVGENLNLGDRANYSTYNLVATNGLNASRDGMNLLIQGGSGYLIAGDGNGGDVTIKAGVRRVAGAGTDGDIHIDTGTGGGLYFDQVLDNDNDLTQLVVRDNTTGEIKYRSVASIEGTPGAYWKTLGNTNVEGDVSISSNTADGNNLVYGLIRFGGIFSNAVLIKDASETHQIETNSFELLTALENDNNLTQILVRDNTTGQIKYRSASSIGALPTTLTTNWFFDDDTPDTHNIYWGSNNPFNSIDFAAQGVITITSISGFNTLNNLKLSTEPDNDNDLTQVLVRDDVTGEIKYKDSSSFGGGGWTTGGTSTLTGSVFINDSGLGNDSIYIGNSPNRIAGFYVDATGIIGLNTFDGTYGTSISIQAGGFISQSYGSFSGIVETFVGNGSPSGGGGGPGYIGFLVYGDTGGYPNASDLSFAVSAGGQVILPRLAGSGVGVVAIDDDGVLSWSAGGGGGNYWNSDSNTTLTDDVVINGGTNTITLETTDGTYDVSLVIDQTSYIKQRFGNVDAGIEVFVGLGTPSGGGGIAYPGFHIFGSEPGYPTGSDRRFSIFPNGYMYLNSTGIEITGDNYITAANTSLSFDHVNAASTYAFKMGVGGQFYLSNSSTDSNRTSFIEVGDSIIDLSNGGLTNNAQIILSSAGIRLRSSVSGSLVNVLQVSPDGGIGFFAVTPEGQQDTGSSLTNNVTSGGTVSVIDDWTNLTTYATDASAIRNAIFRLAEKLKSLDDAMRTYGLLS